MWGTSVIEKVRKVLYQFSLLRRHVKSLEPTYVMKNPTGWVDIGGMMRATKIRWKPYKYGGWLKCSVHGTVMPSVLDVCLECRQEFWSKEKPDGAIDVTETGLPEDFVR